jgi:NTE family protein
MHQKSSKSTSKQKETVLVMQGGGSLGAYECGVCKVLVKHDIEFDIIAGTSIGAINAAIIAAGYTKEDGIRSSVKRCENFWLELAENVVLPTFLPYRERSQLAAAYSLFYGNQKAFTPLWIMPGGLPYYYFFNSPYLYNISRLKETISKHVDFTKLGSKLRPDNKGSKSNNHMDNNSDSITKHSTSDNDDRNSSSSNSTPRLVLTATNVQTGESAIFDSNDTDITVDHVAASAGYAMYGLPWTRLNGNYFWDGAFVHNTPLKAVTKVSRAEKIVYVSDVFPRKQEKLPASMPETYHRIRDLLFTDRSIQENKETSDMINQYLSLIEQMHEVITSEIHNKHKDANLKLKLDKIDAEYSKLLYNNRGLIIDKIIHIQRIERPERYFIFEDADFSIGTIKELIKQGEEDAEELFSNEYSKREPNKEWLEF